MHPVPVDRSKISSVRGDSTCVDAAAATATAERLITSDGVSAIMGADCSGVTTAVLQNVATAKGVVMISPSATSPALSTIEDNGLFFRTSPSDARQGQVLAEILKEKNVKSAAMSYTNNDYGKGLANSIQKNFEAIGGKITISASHEDGKGDYGAEVAALAQAGGDVLIVAGYLDQFPLWPRPMVPASRVIIQVRKSVMGPGAILPGLVVHNDDGSFTDAASRIMKGDGLYMEHPARKARSVLAKSD